MAPLALLHLKATVALAMGKPLAAVPDSVGPPPPPQALRALMATTPKTARTAVPHEEFSKCIKDSSLAWLHHKRARPRMVARINEAPLSRDWRWRLHLFRRVCGSGLLGHAHARRPILHTPKALEGATISAMSMGEFDLIEQYFWRPAGRGPRHAVVGNGDDCAVLAPRAGMQLAVSTDTLVEGRHFLPTVPPARLGHKCLAVNLSDLAACGATPLAFTLALTLPRVDEAWLADFAKGLLDIADEHDCELIGGDTTAGPLAIGITVMGEVPAGQALLRSGAQPGDDLWVSGLPGEARLALEAFRGTLHPGLSADTFEAVRLAMECPVPRVALGEGLRGLATSAIDVSDGLLGDLGHILQRSKVGASVWVDALPVSPHLHGREQALQRDCMLAGGDDYELLFTVPAARRAQVQALGDALGLPLTRIGCTEADPGLRLWHGALGEQPAWVGCSELANRWTSFDHFKAGA
jgi:thiamine-monophosphate kinase